MSSKQAGRQHVRQNVDRNFKISILGVFSRQLKAEKFFKKIFNRSLHSLARSLSIHRECKNYPLEISLKNKLCFLTLSLAFPLRVFFPSLCKKLNSRSKHRKPLKWPSITWCKAGRRRIAKLLTLKSLIFNCITSSKHLWNEYSMT